MATEKHTSATSTQARDAARPADDGARKPFGMLTGITSLLILLQGLWAGLLLDKGGDDASTWATIHKHAGETAVLLAVICFVWALVKLKHRTELVAGSAVLALAMVVEWFVGHQQAGSASSLLWLHIPLALLTMALSVWLPVRAATAKR